MYPKFRRPPGCRGDEASERNASCFFIKRHTGNHNPRNTQQRTLQHAHAPPLARVAAGGTRRPLLLRAPGINVLVPRVVARSRGACAHEATLARGTSSVRVCRYHSVVGNCCHPALSLLVPSRSPHTGGRGVAHGAGCGGDSNYSGGRRGRAVGSTARVVRSRDEVSV